MYKTIYNAYYYNNQYSIYILTFSKEVFEVPPSLKFRVFKYRCAGRPEQLKEKTQFRRNIRRKSQENKLRKCSKYVPYLNVDYLNVSHIKFTSC